MDTPSIPLSSDAVLIDTLLISPTLGPDCWGKSRPQPASISISLGLKPTFLLKCGETDDVTDSVHYGLLTKRISKLVEGEGTAGGRAFNGVEDLVLRVAEEAVALGGAERVRSVRAVISLPKLVLLAQGGLVVDAMVSVSEASKEAPLVIARKQVEVRGLELPVLIGVNPPERLARQRVKVDLVFYEKDGEVIGSVEYQKLVAVLVEVIEASSYLTLEKFVHEIARAAFTTNARIAAITVKARKPSALSFADYSGVEVTRRRVDYGQ